MTRSDGARSRTDTARSGCLVAALALLLTGSAGAQDSCQRNGTGSCTAGGNSAAVAINVTVTRAIRMSLGSATVVLTPPGGSDYDAGFGQTAAPTLLIKTNAPYALSLRTTQALWTASAYPARADKPSSDLQWGVATGGPFTDVTTAAATIFTGAAGTAGAVIPLQFRVRYAWLLDTPGDYSLPLQLTLTSP